jgi:hypothetical protein
LHVPPSGQRAGSAWFSSRNVALGDSGAPLATSTSGVRRNARTAVAGTPRMASTSPVRSDCTNVSPVP